MDTKTLVKNLHQLLCEENKTGTKYSEAWLSDATSIPALVINKYILNLKADHEIDNCNDEIRNVIEKLSEKLPEELTYIMSVVIHDNYDRIHCESGDIEVYNSLDACI